MTNVETLNAIIEQCGLPTKQGWATLEALQHAAENLDAIQSRRDSGLGPESESHNGGGSVD